MSPLVVAAMSALLCAGAGAVIGARVGRVRADADGGQQR
jgi:hypothetical protein